jgi:hypothetical protein
MTRFSSKWILSHSTWYKFRRSRHQHGQRLPAGAIVGSKWTLATTHCAAIIAKTSATGTPLQDYTQSQICMGIKTGLTEAFVIDDGTRSALLRSDSRCSRFIKPFLTGKDIRRWSSEPSGRWLLYLPHGVDVAGYAAILHHLRPFKEKLERRATKQRWYELQQPQERFVSIYEKPKIVFPDIAKGTRFTLDEDGQFIANTAYAIATDDRYVLGVLNSATVETVYRNMSAQIRGGYLRFFTQHVERIPIPKASMSDRKQIADLVEECLRRKGQLCQDIESEINDRVAALFGVSLSAPSVS